MDVALITAWGTMLTGIATILAVFAGFFTMRKQIIKTSKSTWLNSFKLEAAKLLTLANPNDDRFERMKEIIKVTNALLIMLDGKSTEHIYFEKMLLENFIIMQSPISTGELNDWQYQRFHIYLTHIRNIISDAEKEI